MQRIVSDATRYRVMVGLSTDRNGATDEGYARAAVERIARLYLPAFSIWEGVGSWNGGREASVAVEYIALDDDGIVFNGLIEAVAESIAISLNQAEVWVSAERTEVTRFVQD